MPSRLIRLSLRFVLPLALVIGLIAYAVVPLIDNLTLRWFIRDLDARSQSLAIALQEPLFEYVPQKADKRINQLFDRALRDERLYAIAFCDPTGTAIYKTNTYPASLGCRTEQPRDGRKESLVSFPQGPLHVSESQLDIDGQALGKLILVHDMSFIERRSADTRKYVIGLFSLLAIVISMITVFVAHLSWRDWIASVKGILRGEIGMQNRSQTTPPEVRPLESDLRALLHEFSVERRERDDSTHLWTPEKLRDLLHDELAGDEVLVVSNREPYLHARTRNGIEVQRPASGLVTAVEPVMRACSGTWIAHGSGSADRETVDRDDRVPVPPANPSYTLRRVWLTKEEEKGYYYGFANEGMWPLCHIAHVRPVFRSSDWDQYVAVNQRFADAVVAEARTDDPVVLVQDYHFALLPRMVKEQLPKATIITFWHIPWPNPESFGICPWREEILEGLLGSTILGFHTPFHCKNFLETVDRNLETRIEYESSTVSYGGKLTQVEHYPISIAWPEQPVDLSVIAECRKTVRDEHGLPSNHLLAVGVDRLDYTKGIIERFQAIERMLELHSDLVGKFTMIQIAAPTRSSLDEYQNFETRVRTMVQRINNRFSDGNYQPIILKAEHHDSEQVTRYYRASEVCMVTSLHDGMNLVAKEFIAARDDDRGVLVLSQFTGAARELHEALVVNPYHIEQSAEALHRALTMPEAEQCERMRSMRSLVKDFNIYRWAGRMLLDAARVRQRERILSKIRSHSRKSLRRVV
ncbi:alpha,alpha-trehalose-phosphate synthase (UDP-forming) [Noviherbaspirillum sp. Root189]|uniref:alpha,alpha-trehalose-phosphate synthase (UDP-forming) n=1 Tax=Noviherbaspirillum sp. Root189 TaxID=1736487 RepID=UPI00070BF7D0|nr:trehalose-6-phosphate synthase [Noviherbaspirillum sp. Root189]KRB66352.1 alpha,alpha-trehalose-phosphate synthase [Noviherbaspirillum sp. Root189]